MKVKAILGAIRRRPALVGAVTGSALAVKIVFVAWFNEGVVESEIIRALINFFASVPVIVFNRALADLPLLANILFIAYWALVGALLAKLIAEKRRALNFVAFFMVLSLLISHRVAQVKMEQDLNRALATFGQGLSEVFNQASPPKNNIL